MRASSPCVNQRAPHTLIPRRIARRKSARYRATRCLYSPMLSACVRKRLFVCHCSRCHPVRESVINTINVVRSHRMFQKRAISHYTLFAAKELSNWSLARPPQTECFCPMRCSRSSFNVFTTTYIINTYILLKKSTLFRTNISNCPND